MTRLCLIGNSHLAALVLAWRELEPRYPGVSITFFGAKGRHLEGLRVSECGLRPDTDALRDKLLLFTGGVTEIVAEDYDEFWFVGHEFGVPAIVNVYGANWAEGHRPDPERRPVSDLLFAELADAALRGTLTIELYRRLRQVTDAPVRVICQPAPSVAALRSSDARYCDFWLAEAQGDRPTLQAQTDAALDRIADAERIRVSRQPEATRAGPLHSSEAFARGSVRLGEGLATEHGQQDCFHMNADYGCLMLEPCLDELVAERARMETATTADAPEPKPGRRVAGWRRWIGAD